MTTDFSQAIVNGFGIAAKWREMGQQEERVRLDEAYRRDSMAQNRSQFNERIKQMGLDRAQAGKQFDARLEQIGLDSERNYNLGVERNRLTGRSISADEEKNRIVRDRIEYEKTEARNAQSAGFFADALLNGNYQLLGAAGAAILQDPAERKRMSLKVTAGERGDFFEMASGKGALTHPVVTDKGVAFVGSKDDGSLGGMTEPRAPGNDGAIAYFPVEELMGPLIEKYADSPAALAQLRRALSASDLIASDKVAKMSDAEVLGTVRDISADKAAQTGGQQPSVASNGASNTQSPPQGAPQLSAEPGYVQQAGNRMDALYQRNNQRWAEFVAPWPTNGSDAARSAGKRLAGLAGGVVDTAVTPLRVAGEEYVARPVADFAGGLASGITGDTSSNTSVPAGSSVPPQASSVRPAESPQQPAPQSMGLSAPPNSAVRNWYNAQNAFGVQPKANDIASSVEYNTMSGDLLAASAESGANAAKRLGENIDALNKDLSRFANADKSTREFLPLWSDAANLAIDQTDGAVVADARARNQFANALTSMGLQLRGQNVTAEELAGVTIGKMQMARYGVDPSPEQSLDAIERARQFTASRGGASPDQLANVMALYMRAQQGGVDPARLQAALDAVLPPSQ